MYRKFGSPPARFAPLRRMRASDKKTMPDFPDQQWRAREPLRHCSRPVILNGRRRRPRHLVCGDRCRNAIYQNRRYAAPPFQTGTRACLRELRRRFYGTQQTPSSCSRRVSKNPTTERLRPATEHVCANCGASFNGAQPRIYCSRSCGQKAY